VEVVIVVYTFRYGLWPYKPLPMWQKWRHTLDGSMHVAGFHFFH